MLNEIFTKFRIRDKQHGAWTDEGNEQLAADLYSRSSQKLVKTISVANNFRFVVLSCIAVWRSVAPKAATFQEDLLERE